MTLAGDHGPAATRDRYGSRPGRQVSLNLIGPASVSHPGPRFPGSDFGYGVARYWTGELRINVATDDIIFRISYSPHLVHSAFLESWVNRWTAMFDALDRTAVIAPTGEILVNYDDSDAELVALVERFPDAREDSFLAGTAAREPRWQG